MSNDVIAVTNVLQAWAEATREGRQDDVLRSHESTALIYDVLPPLFYPTPAAYRAGWGDWQPETRGENRFELEDLRVTAGADVAFAHGLIQCGGTAPNGTTFRDTVRATFCLTKHDRQWQIAHQHISKPFSTK
jgi:ketosteroid isomerase-like protein